MSIGNSGSPTSLTQETSLLDMTVRGFVLRLTENIARHKFLFILPAIVMAAIAFNLSQGSDEYESTGIVSVNGETFLASLTDVRTEGFSFRSPADLANEQLYGLLSTDTFMADVVDQSGLEAQLRVPGTDDETFFDSIREAIGASPGGDNFLSIYATAGDPVIAQALAEATIETYVQWQINADLEDSRLAESFVEDLIVQYSDELGVAQEQLAAWVRENPGPTRAEDRPIDEQVELQALQTETQEAGERLNTAITKREDARLAAAQAEADVRQSFAVIDSPTVPVWPTNGTLDMLMMVFVFACAGLFLSLAALSLLSASDTTVRFPSEVEDLLETNLLAVLPKVATT